nr:uncharacterized protein LOC112778775 [Arachis hypogaea]
MVGNNSLHIDSNYVLPIFSSVVCPWPRVGRPVVSRSLPSPPTAVSPLSAALPGRCCIADRPHLCVVLLPVEEDGVRKVSRLSVKEAIALPSNTKIVLPFNKELQPIGQTAGLFSGFLGSLGADYSQFLIYAESWKHVNKAKKEHAYDMIKRVFYYEDDAGGKIKRRIMKRIGKNWKDTRHNLYHKCYKETRTYEKNLDHRPKGIEENEWKRFLNYRQKEKKQRKSISINLPEYVIVVYIIVSISMIQEKEQGRPEAIANVERKDESSKHLSQNDSLAQVLGKEQSGRVRALGAGPCPTQVFGNAAGQPSGFAEPNEEYGRRIAELTAKLEEEQAKRQLIHKRRLSLATKGFRFQITGI